MQFRILRTELLSALNKVSRAVSSKSPLPVLTGIKFNLTEDALILTGSDSDITIETTIEKNEKKLMIYQPGAVVLAGHYISEIIRKIESEYIDIEIIDGTLTRIKGDRSEFNLNGIKAIDYPKIDLTCRGEHFTLDSLLLKTIITQTVFATSDKETRPILTGVNFRASDGELSCIATDSYRLAKKVIAVEEGLKFNITIPAKSLNEIAKIIEKVEDIDVYVSERKILFNMNGSVVQTRLIDGAFPDTSRLIPTTFDYELTVDTRDILSAIDRASLFASDASNIVKLTMRENNVQITSKSQEIGSVEEDLHTATFAGNPLNISYSAKYVTDAIRSIGSNQIKIYFVGDMKPFIIKNEEDESLIQLVLPVRTY